MQPITRPMPPMLRQMQQPLLQRMQPTLLRINKQLPTRLQPTKQLQMLLQVLLLLQQFKLNKTPYFDKRSPLKEPPWSPLTPSKETKPQSLTPNNVQVLPRQEWTHLWNICP